MVKALPMPKTSPADTAKGVLAASGAVRRRSSPTPWRSRWALPWNRSHKEFERVFASF
jgi:hypothetical protein